jgi:hypothetical protein
MDLDEVIGIVAFLGHAFQVGLANNVDFHFSFLLFCFCFLNIERGPFYPVASRQNRQ